MPSMTNPMDGFVSFQPALDAGEIELQRGNVDRDAWVLMDRPDGRNPRWTYVRLDEGVATAMAVACMADPFEGKPVFQLGYAVLEHLRGQGRAKDIAAAAVKELTAGLARNGIRSFHIELVVSRDNPASIGVARALTDAEPVEIIDEDSGTPAYQFMKLIGG